MKTLSKAAGIPCDELTWQQVQDHERQHHGGLWLWHPPDHRYPEILRLTVRPVPGFPVPVVHVRDNGAWWTLLRKGRVLPCTADGYPIEILERERQGGVESVSEAFEFHANKGASAMTELEAVVRVQPSAMKELLVRYLVNIPHEDTAAHAASLARAIAEHITQCERCYRKLDCVNEQKMRSELVALLEAAGMRVQPAEMEPAP
jgi:hypothetical protein